MKLKETKANVYWNGFINVVDGRGITQTYYVGTNSYTWRDCPGQVGKTEGSWRDFWKRLEQTFEENENG